MFEYKMNERAYELFMEFFQSTESLLAMGLLVVLAGCFTWIFIRGLGREKLARLNLVIVWMALTQALQMVAFEGIGRALVYFGHPLYFETISFFNFFVLRIGLWVLIGLCIGSIPFISRGLDMRLSVRVWFLICVNIVMRLMLFTILGGLLVYGLNYPKLLSKVARVAPACRDVIGCMLQSM